MADKLAYSMAEAAEVLGVSRPTVYTLAKRTDFPSFKVGNRTLVSAQGLREWVAAQVGKEEAV
ncbi:MAG: helix-turn-helix domain-containing protein [Oscillospiraceae bacterium]|nr:helix-turn-helix domain-containing protein [Oscillospiraceae bacterium]